MNRTLGVSVKDGNLALHNVDCFKCRCIKDRKFKESIPVGALTVGATNPYAVNDSWIKGKLYDYYIDVDPNIINPYGVFVNDTNSTNNLTKGEFEKYFVSLVDYRNNLIDDIIK